jgi:hypothetical protein
MKKNKIKIKGVLLMSKLLLGNKTAYEPRDLTAGPIT